MYYRTLCRIYRFSWFGREVLQDVSRDPMNESFGLNVRRRKVNKTRDMAPKSLGGYKLGENNSSF
jgi:hypothetical protein